MKCTMCGSEFNLTRQAVNYRTKNNVPMDVCPACRKAEAVKRQKLTKSNMSTDRKREWYKKISDARKREYSNMSSKEKEERFGYLAAEAVKYRSNMTEEQKQAERMRASETFSKYWANLSVEERANKSTELSARWESFSDEKKRNIRMKQSASMKRNWSEKTDEERKEAAERSRKYWESLSEDKREEIRQHLTNVREEYWSNLSDEQRRDFSKKMSKQAKEYHKNMSPEKRLELNQILSDKAKERWANLPKELREMWIEHARAGLQEYWNRMSTGKKIQHFFNTADGMANNYTFHPTPSEIQFINKLTQSGIDYKHQWNNKSISDEFYNYYTMEDNPYHVWDFMIHTREKDVLVDIDGSIHLIPEGKCKAWGELDIGELIQYRDTKRKYQTDGFTAYVVRAYSDKIDSKTIVSNLQTGECMEFNQFMALLNFWSVDEDEQKSIIGLVS